MSETIAAYGLPETEVVLAFAGVCPGCRGPFTVPEETEDKATASCSGCGEIFLVRLSD